ncbi:hypothetical protein J4H86_20730 [Spiractinospora alimapuensis]|uniref:hypothetical protein n=1 Tax=Spiractinospora alimapuensis TaxID=2820884 RepID=UPI001F2307F0|nr:hypothetical protein [Spiractinospora alimapuensis]QVQ51226.1 hypothetical protein J4H86_20730 [Spiractinospora alimapuensis]
MTRIAVTGHRLLPLATEVLVDQALRAELERYDVADLVGISCLADGADSLFARAVLDAGGDLVVVVPAQGYRDGLPAAHHPVYDDLLAHASEVLRLEFEESTAQSHMAASETMLQLADTLLAVWDGQPARGFGGTADVIAAAQSHGLPITTIWPTGATRD